jgi:hypothetical protein
VGQFEREIDYCRPLWQKGLMPKRSSKDVNQIAASIVDQVTQAAEEATPPLWPWAG